MTRKDYELIAAAIQNATEAVDFRLDRRYNAGMVDNSYSAAFTGIETAAELIADSLAATNPRFDRARFLKACGIHGE